MKFENTFRITQWGYGKGAGKKQLYMFSVPVDIVAEKAKIFTRTPKRRNGYQRILKETRLGRGKTGIAGYILNQMGIFPTSVMVNVRREDGALKFGKKYTLGENMEVGDLTVPDDFTWYIVDGQHRIEGLKEAAREQEELKDYPLLVTMTNEDIFYEMLIFYMVNDRQKSVPTDLVYRILQRAVYDPKAPEWARLVMGTGSDRRKAIGAQVVDLLNQKERSPFKGRIREVGEVEKPEHLVKDGQLIRYVSIILKESAFSGMYDGDVADILASYWTAIKKTYPKCFKDRDEYLLLDTIGLSSLNRLFPTIYGYCAKDADVSMENMGKYVKYLLEETKNHDDPDFRGPITEEWWHRVEGRGIIHGTGEGHYGLVAEKLARKIALVVQRRKGGTR
ncbi:hypothetical protein ES703_00844 [subsurface metagenome]